MTGNRLVLAPAASSTTGPLRDPGSACQRGLEAELPGSGAGRFEETGVCAERDDVILWQSHLGDSCRAWTDGIEEEEEETEETGSSSLLL